MIGQVHFRPSDAARDYVLALSDSGQWSCPGLPDLASALDLALSPNLGRSPADGQVGHAQLYEAGRLLGGRVEVEERDEPEAGEIF